MFKPLTAFANGAVSNLAQAIWIEDDFPVEADFMSTNQKFYDAEVGNLDFKDPKAVAVVNSWA